MLPGYTYATDPPMGDPRTSALVDKLDRVETVAVGIERKIHEAITALLDKADETRLAIDAAIVGAVGSRLNSAQTKGSKVTQKIARAIDNRLGTAYTAAGINGARYPLVEDAVHGLETGDYFGSMGVQPGPQGSALPGQNNPATADFQVGPPAINPPPGPLSPVPCEDLPGGCPPGEEFGQPNLNAFPPAPPPPPPPGRPPPPPQPELVCVRALTGGLANTIAEMGPFDIDGVQFWKPKYDIGPRPTSPPCAQWRAPEASDFRLNGVWWFSDFIIPESTVPVWRPNGPLMAVALPIPAGWCSDGFLKLAACESGPTTPPPPEPPLPPGRPPLPPVPDCGPVPEWPARFMPMDPDVCKAIADAMAKTQSEGLAILDWIGYSTQGSGALGTIASAVVQAVTGSDKSIVETLIHKLKCWLRLVAEDGVKRLGCDKQALVPFAINQALLGFIDQWFKCVPPQLTETVRQLANTACQSLLPSGAGADAAFLNGQITQAEWECWQKAAGNHLGPAKQVMHGQRTRPDAAQLALLHRRQQLSKDDYEAEMRKVGVLTGFDRGNIWNLTQAWPGLEDVIRFLVRDVSDDKIVTKFGLSDQFGDKWQGDLIKYADALGVPKELAEFYWRAHWKIPSYTQLTYCLHRLRPGVVDKKIEVTEDDVRTALAQDDMLPWWIDRMMAVSYHPVNRTDALEAYKLHVIDEEKLGEIIQDDGYKKENADILVGLYKKKREVDEAKKSGLPTIRALFNQYAKGELSAEDLRATIKRLALTEEHENEMLESAFLVHKTYNRRVLIRNIKSLYMKGLLESGEATAALTDGGMDSDEADNLVNDWVMERGAKGKFASGAQLCQWWGMGLVTDEEHAKGLGRLGYSRPDIANIQSTCKGAWNDKAQARAMKAAREAQRELEKAQQKAARAREKAEAATEKRYKEARAEQDKIRKAAEKAAKDCRKAHGEPEPLPPGCPPLPEGPEDDTA